MSDNPAEQVLSDLFGYLELLETQSGALLQFLKDHKIASDEQLAPYMEQSANASSVKWRAARVRMQHLFAVSQDDKSSASGLRPRPSEKLDAGQEREPEREIKPGGVQAEENKSPEPIETNEELSTAPPEKDVGAKTQVETNPQQSEGVPESAPLGTGRKEVKQESQKARRRAS